MVVSSARAVEVVAEDNNASNHSRGKIKTVSKVRATNRIVSKNLRVPVERRLSKAEDKIKTADKTRAVISGIILTGNLVARDKTVTGQTEVADNKVVSSKNKIPATTAGRRNNEVLIGTSGFTPGVF